MSRERFVSGRIYNSSGCKPWNPDPVNADCPMVYETRCQYVQNMNYDITRDAFLWPQDQVFPLFLTPQMLSRRRLSERPGEFETDYNTGVVLPDLMPSTMKLSDLDLIRIPAHRNIS